MSDEKENPVAIQDQMRKAIRDSAGEEAEARWKASEERQAREQEARTGYMQAAQVLDEQRTVWGAGNADRYAENHALNLRLQAANERIAAAAEAQNEALLRIAAAIEGKG